MKSKRPASRRLLGALAAFAVLALVAWAILPDTWFGAQHSSLEGALVRRGPLRISVVEKGNLKSTSSVSLKSEIEGQTTILYLIEEGKHVQPGELLVELDATKLVEQRVQQEISLRNAEAAYVKSAQQLEIQRSQNDSDISAAERQLDFAERDLAKYLNGDWPQQRKSAEEKILLAQEELKRAQEKVSWSEKLEERGFLTRTELDADRLSATRSEILVEQARRDLDLLEQYDYPRQLKAYEADVEEFKRELVRVRLQAEARRVDADAATSTSKAKYELEQERLGKLLSQVEKARIKAPVAGMVVYSQQDGGRWGGGDPIAEGTAVRERQEIINIPASGGGMSAEVSLHESVLEQVEVGQPCVISIDALPGRTFLGRVEFKAVLPDKNSWWANPNLRLYRTNVEVLDPGAGMRPGMSCSVEILSEEIADALHVPLQAVFLNKGEPVCFVSRAGAVELREVLVGRHNSKWVQITSGLSEGETVLLAQPAGFALEPAIAEPAVEAVPPLPGEGGRGAGGERAGSAERAGGLDRGGAGGERGRKAEGASSARSGGARGEGGAGVGQAVPPEGTARDADSGAASSVAKDAVVAAPTPAAASPSAAAPAAPATPKDSGLAD